LRRQDRSDQRAGSGNGGEMMSEEDPALGGHEVATVGEPLGGSGPAVVHAEHSIGDESAIETVGQEIGADCGEHQPRGTDRLAPVEREGAPRHSSCEGECQPAD
jgi:hypothetical protein